VKIVTTACDTHLDEDTGFICPGLGNFGDRYFGTDLICYSFDTDDGTSTSFEPCTPTSPKSDPRKFPIKPDQT
jgi:uracil phosphoribosyltransferase-like protein